MNRLLLSGLFASVFVFSTGTAAEELQTSEAKKDRNGWLVHEIRSSYQAKPTQVRVLLPEKMEKEARYPVVYLLPVEAELESRYGDGLKEVQKLNLHNQRSAIFVAPSFSHLPWFADHPTKPDVRQESYFIKVVVPFIDKTYPVRAESKSRLLLGFSKSGWGAWSLLLRNPEWFGKAVAWDAPLMMDKPGKYGSGDIFGSQINFERYQVSRLLNDQADKLQKQKRLILLGYGSFRAEHEETHALLEKLKIPHEFRDGPARKHDWHSGWVKEAVDLLFE